MTSVDADETMAKQIVEAISLGVLDNYLYMIAKAAVDRRNLIGNNGVSAIEREMRHLLSGKMPSTTTYGGLSYPVTPKIEAIKEYRQRTGCGLKEAKDYIEVLIDRMVAERAKGAA